MLILTGSQALKYWYPSSREPKDVDLLAWKKDINGESHLKISDKHIEIQFFDDWKSYQHLISVTDSSFKVKTPLGYARVLPPEYLCILKRSHLYRELNWYKHIKDFHLLWRGKFTDYGQTIYEEILAETKQKYPDKTPSLNKSKDQFFDDNVVKYFEHDYIHSQVCHYDRPLYERCQKNTDVFCYRSLFDNLSFEDKCKMVREEAFVIALERKLIPKYKEGKPAHIWYTDAFMWAVMRICTTLCRGWFREFAQLNFPSIIDCDHKTVFHKFITENLT